MRLSSAEVHPVRRQRNLPDVQPGDGQCCRAVGVEVHPVDPAAFGKQKSCWLYRFAALTDLTPETFLTGKVWYPCVGDALALVKGGVS